MTNGKSRYVYDGPVMDQNGKVICARYIASTYATTYWRALSNVTYKYKMTNGLEPHLKLRIDEAKLILND